MWKDSGVAAREGAVRDFSVGSVFRQAHSLSCEPLGYPASLKAAQLRATQCKILQGSSGTWFLVLGFRKVHNNHLPGVIETDQKLSKFPLSLSTQVLRFHRHTFLSFHRHVHILAHTQVKECPFPYLLMNTLRSVGRATACELDRLPTGCGFFVIFFPKIS